MVEGRWKQEFPPDRAYKRRAGAVAPAREQDPAAAGRHRQTTDVDDGHVARASITLRVYRRTRRIRAYLRWSSAGKTVERYVCEVSDDTRERNLAEAWRQAREKGLVAEDHLPLES